MRYLAVVAILVACQKDKPTPGFRASCKPNANLENMECTVENIGKKPGRACVTAREQVPKSRPLVAQRVCTGVIEPGKSVTFRPKFDGLETLQPMCSPDGKWICRDEIVETPEMLDQNISSK